MTEGEELKKVADKQLVTQRLDEIAVYVDKLGKDIDKAFHIHIRAGYLWLMCFATHMVTIFAMLYFPSAWASINNLVADLLQWIAVGYLWVYAIPFFMGCRDELRGCFKTLEILGIIDKRDGRKRKFDEYKESWIAKLWESMKQKARSSAYQPT